MRCTHCRSELREHGPGAKQGALHCDGCGCCFLADGKTPREGVPVCDLAQEAPTSPATPEPESPAEEEAEPDEPTEEPTPEPTPRRRSRR